MDVRHQPGLCGVTSLSTNNVNTANPDQKSAYSYDDLLACARGQLFGPGNARLPLPGMLMLDRISPRPRSSNAGCLSSRSPDQVG